MQKKKKEKEKKWHSAQFTFQDLPVALKSLQHVTAQTLKGFIGRGKESVMTRLTQLLQQTSILHYVLNFTRKILSQCLSELHKSLIRLK